MWPRAVVWGQGGGRALIMHDRFSALIQTECPSNKGKGVHNTQFPSDKGQ